MSILSVIKTKLGLSNTPSHNFILDASADDGTLKIKRESGENILTVDSSGAANFSTAVSVGGSSLLRLAFDTAKPSTSETTIDFNTVPSWAKKITIMFVGVSTSGKSLIQIQAGTASGPVTSGYSGYYSMVSPSSASGASTTTGFAIYVSNASNTVSGNMTIVNFSGNTWVASVNTGSPAGAASAGGGSISLPGTLDRIRITTVNGTDTFDAGSVNIMYEG